MITYYFFILYGCLYFRENIIENIKVLVFCDDVEIENGV